MSKSVKSVYVVVRLDFMGSDVGRKAIDDALIEMDWDFKYEDNYLTLINSEIVESLRGCE